MTSDHTYKVIELVGSSAQGLEPAIESAIARAGQTLHNLDWFEVKEIRGQVEEGKVAWHQVKMGIGFRVLDPEDLHRE